MPEEIILGENLGNVVMVGNECFYLLEETNEAPTNLISEVDAVYDTCLACGVNMSSSSSSQSLSASSESLSDSSSSSSDSSISSSSTSLSSSTSSSSGVPGGTLSFLGRTWSNGETKTIAGNFTTSGWAGTNTQNWTTGGTRGATAPSIIEMHANTGYPGPVEFMSVRGGTAFTPTTSATLLPKFQLRLFAYSGYFTGFNTVFSVAIAGKTPTAYGLAPGAPLDWNYSVTLASGHVLSRPDTRQ